ncbi:L-2-hydroxyglutarate oxidase [Plantactinospora sp. WMMB782]|uniref:L-2-hydroxyglutarate oxidase n=1 Tax=Plantactinospora sp. WMMB782 TaxID=3404121 RepID=UPI003B95D087
MTRYVIVGGGILGLAVAHRLRTERPRDTVAVLEKESGWAAHQTGHNSGVIHAGVYYRPGSLKASLCRAGSASMVRFCAEQGLPYEVCGKLIVATEPAELPRLHALHERAVDNGLPVTLVDPIEAAEYEPHVAAVAALRVASTGIVDFGAVCRRLAELLADSGAELRLRTRVTGIRARPGELVVRTDAGEVTGDVLVNCAGLHADRLARLAGIDPPARIVPFRGEYHELVPQRRHLVRGLIYPVPDPQFPFLGVHLTRTVDRTVHAGPNAVLATAREGYSWRRFDPRDVWEQVGYSGLRALARRHYRYGLTEMARSLSRRRFAASLARLVPELTGSDIVPAGAGVRAQAVRPDGTLLDDFLIVEADRQVHVLNAPSPAATSSFEIARHIVDRLPVDR